VYDEDGIGYEDLEGNEYPVNPFVYYENDSDNSYEEEGK
jgi:hypothetical protein